jgi:hypothetical protein
MKLLALVALLVLQPPRTLATLSTPDHTEQRVSFSPSTIRERKAFIDTCVGAGGIPVVIAAPDWRSSGIDCAKRLGE